MDKRQGVTRDTNKDEGKKDDRDSGDEAYEVESVKESDEESHDESDKGSDEESDEERSQETRPEVSDKGQAGEPYETPGAITEEQTAQALAMLEGASLSVIPQEIPGSTQLMINQKYVPDLLTSAMQELSFLHEMALGFTNNGQTELTNNHKVFMLFEAIKASEIIMGQYKKFKRMDGRGKYYVVEADEEGVPYLEIFEDLQPKLEIHIEEAKLGVGTHHKQVTVNVVSGQECSGGSPKRDVVEDLAGAEGKMPAKRGKVMGTASDVLKNLESKGDSLFGMDGKRGGGLEQIKEYRSGSESDTSEGASPLLQVRGRGDGEENEEGDDDDDMIACTDEHGHMSDGASDGKKTGDGTILTFPNSCSAADRAELVASQQTAPGEVQVGELSAGGGQVSLTYTKGLRENVYELIIKSDRERREEERRQREDQKREGPKQAKKRKHPDYFGGDKNWVVADKARKLVHATGNPRGSTGTAAAGSSAAATASGSFGPGEDDGSVMKRSPEPYKFSPHSETMGNIKSELSDGPVDGSRESQVTPEIIHIGTKADYPPTNAVVDHDRSAIKGQYPPHLHPQMQSRQRTLTNLQQYNRGQDDFGRGAMGGMVTAGRQFELPPSNYRRPRGYPKQFPSEREAEEQRRRWKKEKDSQRDRRHSQSEKKKKKHQDRDKDRDDRYKKGKK